MAELAVMFAAMIEKDPWRLSEGERQDPIQPNFTALYLISHNVVYYAQDLPRDTIPANPDI